MNSPRSLNVLLVEDNPDDELLISRELRKGGLAFGTERIATRDQFHAALDRGDWDIILADYALPGFSGLEALSILRARESRVPFILVSGTVGEEIAVDAIRAGAHDYLLKQNLIRLVPAVTRAIREAHERRQREATEHALQEHRARLELIYNSVSGFLAFLTRTPEGRWLYTSVNRAFVLKLGETGQPIPVDRLLGREVEDVEANEFRLDAETMRWFADLRHRAIGAGRPVTAERELRLVAGVFVGEFTFIPVVGPDGACRHLLIDGRDVTAQRRAEEQDRRIRDHMIQAHKLEALGTLAGGIAHDFNNILTGIFGFAELAKMAPDLTSARRQSEEIIRAAHRAKELVGRILTFSRQQPTNRQPVPLTDVVRELVPLMRASFPKSVELAVRLPEPGAGPGVLADSGQLQQVILNLCTNATHAMPAGGHLVLAVEATALTDPVPTDLAPLVAGPHAKLTVSDTGAGMAPDTLRRVFEPFFTTKPVGQGTGLGLSVVHGIVRDHRGAIRVTSAVGRGTTFEIFLPVVAGSRAEDTPAPPVPTGRGERVLCVDDDPVLVAVTAHLLTELGYEPVPFTDPVAAFAEFSAGPAAFAAVLTDNRMPTWSGVELARRVSQLRTELPIVLVSGAVDPEALSSFQALRYRHLLAKPYTLAQLAQVMSHAVGRGG